MPNQKNVARVAKIFEPDVPGCDPDSTWKVRLERDDLSNRCKIAIRFAQRNGSEQLLRIDAAQRTDHRAVRRELDAHNARLPDDDGDAREFIERLVRKYPGLANCDLSSTEVYEKRQRFRDAAQMLRYCNKSLQLG